MCKNGGGNFTKHLIIALKGDVYKRQPFMLVITTFPRERQKKLSRNCRCNNLCHRPRGALARGHFKKTFSQMPDRTPWRTVDAPMRKTGSMAMEISGAMGSPAMARSSRASNCAAVSSTQSSKCVRLGSLIDVYKRQIQSSQSWAG